MAKVLVVGSINMDLVVQTTTFPRLGETLFGQTFATFPGGKGANQAVAAARLGAQVSMLGCVGRDAFGAQLKAGLAAEGIDTQWVFERDVASGVAAITVTGGDNAIVVVPGANYALTTDDLDAAEAAFVAADVILAQLEIPLPVVQHAAALALRHGKTFFLNPAPATVLPQSLIGAATLLTPNEFELAAALGAPDSDWSTLLPRLPGKLVMTHGKHGAYYADHAGKAVHQPGFPVTAVDSTGAGDTFNGALAAFWHLGVSDAVRHANAAGALSVTKAGAQSGMPKLAELNAFLSSQTQGQK
ncbi:ribokinase [Amantichitinum ursilacus]|uniref:Ribokinase n=1 Tax=Amantichitinum ursilacus TaxID=857265 RepID=A0A0N0XGC9_9NEIS|nr:ribokinase [Amantichitinum ursilacus]KPC49663.1 Ribokinase [Amantichitinum ursilacus]